MMSEEPTPMAVVHPNDTWLTDVKQKIDHILHHGNDYKTSSCIRTMSKVLCIPVCCSLCCLWSTLWRVMCCPVSCFMGHGPLSNNGCTDLTDKCIVDAYKDADKKQVCEVPASYNDMVSALKYFVSNVETAADIKYKYDAATFMGPVYKKVREIQLIKHKEQVTDVLDMVMINGEIRKLGTLDVLPYHITSIVSEL